MAEKAKDIHFGYSPEVVEFAKAATLKSGRTMAVVVKAVYDKCGQEGLDVIAAAVKDAAKKSGEMHREQAGYKPEEVDVKVALGEIYPNSHKPLGAAGLDLERIKFSNTESESHVHYCALLESWKTVWDEPWHMCRIFSAINDVGYMEGVNPKLEWIAHAEKDNQSPGLAHGDKTPCVMKLRCND